MRRILILTIVLSMVLVLGACGSTGDNAPDNGANGSAENGAEEKGEIVFGVTPWSTTIPPTTIAQLILEDMGYQVTWREADVGLIYSGLASGDIDVFMDSWLPILHANYMEQFGDKIEDLAVSYPDADLGWVVPSYVEEVNSIEDLNEHADLFGGKVYGIDEGAGMTKTSRELIDVYDLDIEYVASSEAAMLSQAATAIQAQEPILFLGYRPHSMFAMWDLKILEDPKGIWESSEVHVVANKDFKNKAPEAYNFLKNWSIPLEDLEQMILEIDQNNADPKELAKQWIEANQEKVAEMTGQP